MFINNYFKNILKINALFYIALRERLFEEPFLAPGFFLHPPSFFIPYLHLLLETLFEERLERLEVRLERLEVRLVRLEERLERLERLETLLEVSLERLERLGVRLLREPFLGPAFFLHPPSFFTPYLHLCDVFVGILLY